MNQPRLLADFAAVPTPRERRHARATNRAAQLGMFDAIDDDHQADNRPCDVCASLEHVTEQCQHGTAPALELDNTPERVAERRAMFTTLGWSTTP